jgi:hypothetical protein
MRDLDDVDAELCLVAVLRDSIRSEGGVMPSVTVADRLLDERLRITDND